jgi:asparagine synthase (glutamine-hydrolysing)
MCGICGILDFSGSIDLEKCVRQMADSLWHRGPDDEGTAVFRTENGTRLALGHRRLSIIDLSPAARQPMTSCGGGASIVFNGEMYNSEEKRQICGTYPFRSRSDTEVVLALYEKLGEEFVQELEGMFALALWDQSKQVLLLARDRAGKKPLYYTRGKGFLAFASEIKALLTIPGFSPEMDDSALPLYLTFGYVPTPQTFYREIQKLPPGSTLAIRADGSAIQKRYWQYPLSAQIGALGAGTAVETLRGLLETAVSRRMRSDVPLGAFLSGGLDSTVITSIMSRISREQVKTFSIGFQGDPAYDETEYARLAANTFKTHHTEFRVAANAIGLMETLVHHYDEPFGDSSAIPTYIISQLARRHVTVALSGDGGDEVFGGYERMAAALYTERIPRALLAAGKFLAQKIRVPAHAKNRRQRWHRFFSKAALPLADRCLEWNSFFSRKEIAEMCPSSKSVDVAESFQRCFVGFPDGSVLKQILFLNFTTYLLDDLLVKTDRMSMAHGLEVRCPFLDTALVEWAASLPDNMKIRRGTLKYILRYAYRDIVPQPILDRAKMGFGVPLGFWMRKDLREYSHDLLLGPSARIGSFVERQSIENLLREHEAQLRDNGQRIWCLLTLEVWLRRGTNPSIAPVPFTAEEN